MAYLRNAFSPDDPTITFHLEEGEALPTPGDIIEIEEDSFELGELIYEKYGIATYKVVHHVLVDKFE